jgi:hypothetical protein
MDNKCVNCSEYKKCKDSRTSWIFFLAGLISTIAVRIVTVLIDINPFYGKLAWYIGVAGFFIFFIYKFKIDHARARLVNKRNLINKVLNKGQLAKEDSDLIGSILCAISSSKDKINYFFIFASSALALIAAVYFDFIR